MTKYNNLNNAVGAEYDNQYDGYESFEKSLKEFFNDAINSGKKLFKTAVSEDLFEVYLDHLPEEARQHYSCNACRHFVNRFGGLVFISEKGNITSAMWNEQNTPSFFKASVSAMKKVVESAVVTGVFLSDEKKLGIPKTGEWSHLSVELPREQVFRSRLQTASQAMADKREAFGGLKRSLADFSLETVEQALAIIQSETLYRADKVHEMTKWFKGVVEKLSKVKNGSQRDNMIWLEVASAPNEFAFIRSKTAGTLLQDIADGLSFNSIKARFEEKMNPANHMVSQSAPSQNAIYEAERMVAKLGIENALERRYARIEEVPNTLWTPKVGSKVVGRYETGGSVKGVFGNITPKEKVNATASNKPVIPTSVMTWEKFARTVLPTVDGLEVLIDNPDRFMALVTAVHADAENILQWDNTFSWYYHGGIDAEVKRRVENAGGKYDNNEIRASLIWDGYTDLDIHAHVPNFNSYNRRQEEIYFGNKRVGNGWLDIDANGGHAQTATPVENIRWETAPNGRYKFVVHNFQERGNGQTPFKVELEINGEIFTHEGVAGRTGWTDTVFEFDYVKGQAPKFIQSSKYGSASAGGSGSTTDWNVAKNSFVKVNAITKSPNLWNEKAPVTNSGTHVFFLLEGVKDLAEGKGKGFIVEMLNSDLRPIRKTLQAFVGSTPIEDADEATACGVGYNKDTEWNLTVKVTSGNSTRVIKIDRWD
jgi:hypothetical protein